MPISKTFQRRISQLVEEQDLSHKELCKNIQISSTCLSNITLYGILPKTSTIIKIANYFEVSLNYLLGKTNENYFSPSVQNQIFCDRLSLLCNENSITYYKVALDCGFLSSSITRWQKKGYLPSLEILEILCDYFKVSPDYLLGRSDFKD